MDAPATLQARLDQLAHGEVQPLLLATDVERGADLAVHVVLVDPVDGVDAAGHTSYRVFTRRFPQQPEEPASEERVREVRAETVSAFGARLRALLGEEPA